MQVVYTLSHSCILSIVRDETVGLIKVRPFKVENIAEFFQRVGLHLVPRGKANNGCMKSSAEDHSLSSGSASTGRP